MPRDNLNTETTIGSWLSFELVMIRMSDAVLRPEIRGQNNNSIEIPRAVVLSYCCSNLLSSPSSTTTL